MTEEGFLFSSNKNDKLNVNLWPSSVSRPPRRKRPPGIANLPIGVVARFEPLGFASVGTGFQILKEKRAGDPGWHGLPFQRLAPERNIWPQSLLAPSKSA
jgi:hypothetical protein